jgi:mannose-6-phosphate isomerase-like protein (cupin superfamily)
MNYQFPHIIEYCFGEKVIFKSVDPVTDKIHIESFCQPGVGPLMHIHYKQDECLTVVSGKIGYQVLGEEKKYAGPGETVLFKQGVAHKFWAEGEEVLHCKGYVQPANTFIFFLTSVFAAQNKAGGARPEKFDAAYLLSRYSSEYDMVEIPGFVKKVVLPTQAFVGKLLGKYAHFKNAPEPVV